MYTNSLLLPPLLCLLPLLSCHRMLCGGGRGWRDGLSLSLLQNLGARGPVHVLSFPRTLVGIVAVLETFLTAVSARILLPGGAIEQFYAILTSYDIPRASSG